MPSKILVCIFSLILISFGCSKIKSNEQKLRINSTLSDISENDAKKSPSSGGMEPIYSEKEDSPLPNNTPANDNSTSDGIVDEESQSKYKTQKSCMLTDKQCLYMTSTTEQIPKIFLCPEEKIQEGNICLQQEKPTGICKTMMDGAYVYQYFYNMETIAMEAFCKIFNNGELEF